MHPLLMERVQVIGEKTRGLVVWVGQGTDGAVHFPSVVLLVDESQHFEEFELDSVQLEDPDGAPRRMMERWSSGFVQRHQETSDDCCVG